MKRALSLLIVLLSLLWAALPVAAQETEQFVFDRAGILTEAEAAELETAAAAVSAEYGCGVYIVTVADMADDGFYDIERYAEWMYEGLELGYDEAGTGLMLLLSMAERDYDLDAFGDRAHRAFTDYGKQALADTFLDDFRLDDWVGGFADYISNAGALLERADNGAPLDVPSYDGPMGVPHYSEPVFYRERTMAEKLKLAILPGLVMGLLVAFVYCTILKAKMKSARQATEASAYVAGHGLDLRIRDDRFTHSTQVRHHIDRDHGGGGHGGGGGTHISSGGHSHSSGKF